MEKTELASYLEGEGSKYLPYCIAIRQMVKGDSDKAEFLKDLALRFYSKEKKGQGSLPETLGLDKDTLTTAGLAVLIERLGLEDRVIYEGWSAEDTAVAASLVGLGLLLTEPEISK